MTTEDDFWAEVRRHQHVEHHQPVGLPVSRHETHLALERQYDPDKPYLVGYGPAEFSTSQAVETFPSVIWDTNGYYRDMGVHPKATRKQIKKRYQDLDGPGSVRLTMIAGVLLNPERRLKYDMTPFGSFFFDDEIEAARRLEATENVSERLRKGEDLDDILAEDEPDLYSDAMNVEEMNAQALAKVRAARNASYSYYLWRTNVSDTEKVAEWRALLCKWFWYYEKSAKVSVGLMQGEDQVVVREVGDRVVVFLHDQLEPNDVLACLAVAEMRHIK